MANHVRVGVKPIKGGVLLPVDEPLSEATHGVEVHWVEIDGARLPGEIISVKWKGDSGFHSLILEMGCGQFETVDFRESASDA